MRARAPRGGFRRSRRPRHTDRNGRRPPACGCPRARAAPPTAAGPGGGTGSRGWGETEPHVAALAPVRPSAMAEGTRRTAPGLSRHRHAHGDRRSAGSRPGKAGSWQQMRQGLCLPHGAPATGRAPRGPCRQRPAGPQLGGQARPGARRQEHREDALLPAAAGQSPGPREAEGPSPVLNLAGGAGQPHHVLWGLVRPPPSGGHHWPPITTQAWGAA